MQADPQLWERAYQAAWFFNVFAMGKFNVSNVTVGSDPEKPLRLHGRTSQGKQESRSRKQADACSIDLHNAGTIAPNQFGCYAANNSGGVPGDGTFEAAPRLISTLFILPLSPD